MKPLTRTHEAPNMNKQTSVTKFVLEGFRRDFRLTMSNEETCSNLLKSLHNSNQNFLLQVTPFSTKITVKNSTVKRYHKLEPKKSNNDNVQKFESLTKLEHENNFLKSEMQVSKGALEEAILDQDVLADSLKKSDTKVLELEKSLEIINNKFKQALRDFSEKATANRHLSI